MSRIVWITWDGIIGLVLGWTENGLGGVSWRNMYWTRVGWHLCRFEFVFEMSGLFGMDEASLIEF